LLAIIFPIVAVIAAGGWIVLGQIWALRPVRAICAGNLHRIGEAAQRYAADHGWHYPDDIDGLLTQGVTPADFVCPKSADSPAAPGPMAQATAANVKSLGHCSYIYLGKGWMTKDATADKVLAYEPLKNHGGQGMNVLYGDGHVDWVAANEARAVLAELNAGHNPPGSQ
jgi:prepilin-type processing-associated H-X9-DG protein